MLRNCLFLVARPAGFEPATYGLEGRCSIQLSYGRVSDCLMIQSNCNGERLRNQLSFRVAFSQSLHASFCSHTGPVEVS
jgi:hypothetical protein